MEGTTVLEKVLDDAWENYSALVTSKQDHSTTTVKENQSNTNQNLERSLRKVQRLGSNQKLIFDETCFY